MTDEMIPIEVPADETALNQLFLAINSRICELKGLSKYEDEVRALRKVQREVGYHKQEVDG
jgi:hypothetical protein